MEILISEEKGVRQLHFGSQWVQGAMRLSRPDALELEYTREMMLPLLLNPQPWWPRSALFIGLGVGAMPRFLHKHRPQCRIQVVEIEPSVVSVARMHFKLPADGPQFQVSLGCGAAHVAETAEKYDLIFVDGFDENARVGPLNTKDFYSNALARLQPGGWVVANLLSNQKDSTQAIDRFKDAFGGNAVVLPPCSSGNVIALGSQEVIDLDVNELTVKSDKLLEETGLNLSKSTHKLIQAIQGSLKKE